MDVTDVIGGFGPFQRRILYVVMYRAIPGAIIISNAQFFTPDVDYWCARGEVNVSIDEWRSCCVPFNRNCEKYLSDPEGVSGNVTVKCDSWEFSSSKYGLNMKEEWNLVCDRSWLIPLSFTLFTLGNLMSYVPGGHLADKYGRRMTSLIGMTLIVVCGVIGYFSPNMEFFLTVRLITGIIYGIFHTAALCLFLEVVGTDYRYLISLAFMCTWGLGKMILPGLALLVNDWRNLQLITFIPFALIAPILTWIIVPEVARWSLTVGRDEEAEKTILKAAKLNGIEIVDVESVMRDLKKKIKEDELLATTHSTPIDLFRTATIRRMTIVLSLSYFMTVFIYYGFTFNADKLEGSLYMNFFLIGLTEFLGSGFFLLEAKYMRRRRALQINFVLTGLSFFISLAIPKDFKWLRISVALLGQTCNNICYGLLWLLSAEIFPTNLRGVGVSGGMAAGRIGSVLSTFMDPLARMIGKDAPIAIFGILATLTSIIFLLLPETRDKYLPDTVKESERLPESLELKRLENHIDT